MKYLHIKTPTRIDLREIFTLGLTTKRGDESKIGHKGSGMKFTIALLHRLGSNLAVRTDEMDLRSVGKAVEIRGSTHQMITLNGTTIQDGEVSIETHITTEAGTDTWTEPWYALRELLQNVSDEGGSYCIGDVEDPGYTGSGTLMAVPLTEPLLSAWEERWKWHHARCPGVVYEGRQPGLFFHGFRVYDQVEGWKFAYDITDLIKRGDLSEDRQLRNCSMDELFRKILMAASSLPDDFYSHMVSDCSNTDKTVYQDCRYLAYAAYMEANHYNKNPGGFEMEKLEKAFAHAYGQRAAYSDTNNPDAAEHYYAKAAGYNPVYVSNHHTRNLLSYSGQVKDAGNLMPAVEARTRKVKEISPEQANRLKAAVRITRKLRPPSCRIEVVSSVCEGDPLNVNALACHADNKVLLMQDYVESASTEELCSTLVEEYVHLSSGKGDGSISFEKALVQSIVRLIYPKKVAVEGL